MKALCLVLAVSWLVLAGCNDSTPPDRETAAPNTSTAPGDYLNNLAAAEKRATKTVDTAAVNRAIETFYVQEGRFPKDLLELVELKYIPAIPRLPEGASWDYDTNTGVVMIKKSQLEPGPLRP
jgi:hypothetical protein